MLKDTIPIHFIQLSCTPVYLSFELVLLSFWLMLLSELQKKSKLIKYFNVIYLNAPCVRNQLEFRALFHECRLVTIYPTVSVPASTCHASVAGFVVNLWIKEIRTNKKWKMAHTWLTFSSWLDFLFERPLY